MKKIALFFLCTLSMFSCHESIEKRAAREAKEFTEKMCPTPVQNNTRTDSITFDEGTRTMNYYYTFVGPADNEENIKQTEDELIDILRKAIKENVDLKVYKDAHFNFRYIYHSEKAPKKTLLDATFSDKDYQ